MSSSASSLAVRVLILAHMGALAAGAEARAGMADPTDAVPRPGRVLLADPDARAQALANLPDGVRYAWCGGPRPNWPSRGVVRRVRTEGDDPPDERAEPFALTVMDEAAVAFGQRDPGAARALRAQLDRWARGGGLTRFDGDAPNAYYAVARTLLPTIAAWSLVREPGAPETARIDRWLGGLARRLGPDRPAGAVTARNNHHYLAASASMAWGALSGDAEAFAAGPAALDDALDDMRADGSLPLETARGGRALWYQRHAIASLVAIAEMGAAQGLDLYGREGRGGRSLHAAVRFLLDAIDDPAVIRAYADEPQDLGFLVRRGHGRHYMAWAEPYAARFPEREESRRLLALLAARDPGFRPMVDDYGGGNMTCLYAPVPAGAG